LSKSTFKQSLQSLSYSEDGQYRYIATDGSNFQDAHAPLRSIQVVQSSFSGNENPAWRDAIKRGADATTAASGISYKGTNSWISITYGHTLITAPGVTPSWYSTEDSETAGYISRNTFPAFLSVPDSVRTDVNNRCIRKFLQQYTSATSSSNLTGRSIKHLKHDLHTLANPMAGIRNEISTYLSKLEKVSKGRGKRSTVTKSIREAYLELTFGLQPFTEDVTDIVLDIGKFRYPSVPISASAHAKFSGSVIRIGFATFYIPAQIFQNIQLTSVYSVRLKGAVNTHADGSGNIGVLQSNRLLPKDWLPTAISILPYAWMANYFTNVSDVIDSWCFPVADLTWGCRTERIDCVSKSADADFVPSSLPEVPQGFVFARAPFCTIYGGSSELTASQFTRGSIQTSDLVAKLQLKIPTQPKQWLNMMAAFAPRISGIVRSLT